MYGSSTGIADRKRTNIWLVCKSGWKLARIKLQEVHDIDEQQEQRYPIMGGRVVLPR